VSKPDPSASPARSKDVRKFVGYFGALPAQGFLRRSAPSCVYNGSPGGFISVGIFNSGMSPQSRWSTPRGTN